MIKRISYIFAVLILVLIINGLIASIIDLWHKQDILIQARSALDRAKAENASLKKQLSLVQNNSFVEKEARDKLFMVKPGESQVIIEDEQKKKTENQKNGDDKIYLSWLNLFFSN